MSLKNLGEVYYLIGKKTLHREIFHTFEINVVILLIP